MGPPPGGGKRGGLWDGDLASALQQLGPMWLWLVGRACLLVLALALLMLLHSVVPSASYLPLALVGVSTSGLVYVAVQQVGDGRRKNCAHAACCKWAARLTMWYM